MCSPGKRVCRKAPGVRIPLSPPNFHKSLKMNNLRRNEICDAPNLHRVKYIHWSEARGFYLDFRWPKGLGNLSGKRFQCALNARNQEEAVAIRDRIILPIMVAGSQAIVARKIVEAVIDADEMLTKAIKECARSLDVSIPALGLEDGDSLTFRMLGDKYLEYLKTSSTVGPAGIRKYKSCIDGICRICGDNWPVEEITTADISELRDKLSRKHRMWMQQDIELPVDSPKDKLSVSSVQQYLRTLRAVFRWGIDEGKLY